MILLEKLLRPLSYVFHPVFLGLYLLLFHRFIFVSVSQSSEFTDMVFLKMLGTVILLGLLIPMAAVYFFSKDWKLKESKDRTIPTLVGSICSLGIFVLGSFSPYNNSIITYFYLCAAFSLFGVYLVNFSIKVSQHTTAITIFCIFMTISFYLHFFEINTIIQTLIALLFFAVITQRLISKSHSFKEVFLGFILGCFSVLTVIALNVNKII